MSTLINLGGKMTAMQRKRVLATGSFLAPQLHELWSLSASVRVSQHRP